MKEYVKIAAVAAIAAALVIYIDRKMGLIPVPPMAERQQKGDLRPL